MNTDMQYEGVVFNRHAKKSYKFGLIEDHTATQGIIIDGHSYRLMSSELDSEFIKSLFSSLDSKEFQSLAQLKQKLSSLQNLETQITTLKTHAFSTEVILKKTRPASTSISWKDNEKQELPAQVALHTNPPEGAKASLNAPFDAHLSGSPAGGYWTTPEDLRKFGEWIFKETQADEGLKTLVMKYGGEFSKEGYIDHAGDTLNSSAYLTSLLNQNFTVAIVSNQGNCNAIYIRDAIIKNMLSN